MKSPYPCLNDADEALIRKMVQDGKTLWETKLQLPNHRLHDVRSMYQQFKRGKHQKALPTPEEMEALKEEVRRHWDSFTFGRRWVGRYAQNKDSTLQGEASRLMPR